ncbi:hypothetical protein Lser_V15G38984 [Lactuca serriola]
MSEVPSLINLCIGAIKDAILEENGNLPFVYKLPAELFDQLLPNLPPLALQNLQEAIPSVSSTDQGFVDDSLKPSRKRKRFDNFDIAWKALYESRWSDVQKFTLDSLPEDVEQNESTTNWQQIYWERHLQNCLDAVAEMVSITLFDGFLGEVEISDALLKSITYERHLSMPKSYLKLEYHCERFGLYARCLRLRNVHCVAEIGHLLRKSRLEYLETHWIKSKEQVAGLCKLLEQNNDTLSTVEFLNCKLPASLVTAICDSLCVKGFESNVIKNFSIKRSSFLDSSYFPLPLGLESLLSAASGLTKLSLSDSHIWWKTAKMLFDTLLDTESGLQVLDLSENFIAGWLSHFKWGSPNCIKPHIKINKSLPSLRVLNLRSCNLQKSDVDCLKNVMTYMPNLEVLNLSENQLQDEGIKVLIPCLVEKSKCPTPLAELYLEHCELSCMGASQLIKFLESLKTPLKSLSLGYNYLSSNFGPFLGKFLLSGIREIDIKGIGLGSGFSDAQQEITKEISLVRINISDNSGGVGTANLLSKLISEAPNLVSINASDNWIPIESFPAICSCLKASKGKLEHLDLRQNPLCNKPNIASLLAEFQVNGKPDILVSPPFSNVLYDNDP